MILRISRSFQLGVCDAFLPSQQVPELLAPIASVLCSSAFFTLQLKMLIVVGVSPTCRSALRRGCLALKWPLGSPRTGVYTPIRADARHRIFAPTQSTDIHSFSHLSSITGIPSRCGLVVMQLNCVHDQIWRTRMGSNHEPVVLETTALPIELRSANPHRQS
mgnify:CR=1 FL=1